MKLILEVNELVDPEIQAVSLVKRGANRSPFKILKSEDGQVQEAANPRVILHVEPDNAGVDQRYPLGKPTAGRHSLDRVLQESFARVTARKRR